MFEETGNVAETNRLRPLLSAGLREPRVRVLPAAQCRPSVRPPVLSATAVPPAHSQRPEGLHSTLLYANLHKTHLRRQH